MWWFPLALFYTVGPIKKNQFLKVLQIFKLNQSAAKCSSLEGKHLLKILKNFTTGVFGNDPSPDTPPSQAPYFRRQNAIYWSCPKMFFKNSWYFFHTFPVQESLPCQTKIQLTSNSIIFYFFRNSKDFIPREYIGILLNYDPQHHIVTTTVTLSVFPLLCCVLRRHLGHAPSCAGLPQICQYEPGTPPAIP